MQANQKVAEILRELSRYRSVVDKAAWSARAYEQAADTVETLRRPVSCVTQEELASLPGIGAKLARIIADVAQGAIPAELQEARDRIPPSVFTLTALPGIGPARAVKLYEAQGIVSYDDLRERIHRGQAFDEKLLQSFRFVESYTGRIPYSEASEIVHTVLTRLTLGRRMMLQPTGSFRRRKADIGDLDFLLATRFPGRALGVRRRFLELGSKIVSGPYKTSVYYRHNARLVRMDLLVVSPNEWGSALCYFTGDAAHNIALRKRALSRGMVLNEHGLWRSGQRVASKTETEVYSALRLPWHPPHLRTGELRESIR